MPNLESLLASAGLEITRPEIGGGGSAVVHECRVIRDASSLPLAGSLIAAKAYRTEILQVRNQLQRIRQEAELGARLQHPNIVRTFGLLGDVELDQGTSSSLVLLLEWIDGKTLEAWYADQHKPLSWDRIRKIAEDLVGGLEELHRSGVFHRDVKPENVMIRESDGEAVLMDIGVAELAGSEGSTLHTSVKDFVGSARYASPQFILGTDPFEVADDVYSLAATLFLLMTGQQVYAEVERKTVIPIAVVNSSPEVRSLAENVPISMKIVLQGALHRDRKRRPTLAEFRECLVSPDSASYTTKELARQATEVRSYVILETLENGAAFFADLAGESPEIGEVYTVVRQSKKRLIVPSYSREVTPELWVAEAVLKHVHQNVGYFAVQRRQWRESRNSFSSLAAYMPQGQWVDVEGITLTVSIGDLVLRKAG